MYKFDLCGYHKCRNAIYSHDTAHIHPVFMDVKYSFLSPHEIIVGENNDRDSF